MKLPDSARVGALRVNAEAHARTSARTRATACMFSRFRRLRMYFALVFELFVTVEAATNREVLPAQLLVAVLMRCRFVQLGCSRARTKKAVTTQFSRIFTETELRKL